jgi:hypothetical protein
MRVSVRHGSTLMGSRDRRLNPRAMVGHLLPPDSAVGSLVRDAYRWLTPGKPRPKVASLLEALALSRKRVFFVQVGSNDADHGDPLRPFILTRRWSGIMIEPVPYVFERLRRNYESLPDLVLGMSP